MTESATFGLPTRICHFSAQPLVNIFLSRGEVPQNMGPPLETQPVEDLRRRTCYKMN